MSRFKSIANLLEKAVAKKATKGAALVEPNEVNALFDFLKTIDTPEKAAALTGKERQVYLDVLDEIYGPQTQRMKDLGFDTQVLHGTDTDKIAQRMSLDELDNKKQLEGIKDFKPGTMHFAAGNEQGIYTSPAVYKASEYAGDQMYPLVVRGQKHFPTYGVAVPERELSDKNLYNMLNDSNAFEQLSKATGKSIEDLKKLEFNDLVNEIKKSGEFEGIIAGSEVKTFDPSNIRSKFAAFDPRFKKSSNILAGSAGAAVLGSALAPEEAEAGIIDRKTAAKLIKQATKDGALDVDELVKLLQFKPGHTMDTFGQNIEKVQDVFGHQILEKTGVPENEIIKSINQMYPQIEPEKLISPADFPVESGLLGQATVRKHNLTGTIDPYSQKIQYAKYLEKDPTRLSAVLAHESQHSLEQITRPKDKFSIPFFHVNDNAVIGDRILETLNDNPELAQEMLNAYNKANNTTLPSSTLEKLSPRDAIALYVTDTNVYDKFFNNLSGEELLKNASKKHHIDYPQNYELEKLKQITDTDIIKPTMEERIAYGKAKAQKIDEYNKLNEQMKKLRKPAAAVAGTAAVASTMAPQSAEAAPMPSLEKTQTDAWKNLLAPIQTVATAYDKNIQQPIEKVVSKVAKPLAKDLALTDIPYQNPEDVKSRQENYETALQFAGEVALDPLSYTGSGLGATAAQILPIFAEDREEEDNLTTEEKLEELQAAGELPMITGFDQEPKTTPGFRRFNKLRLP